MLRDILEDIVADDRRAGAVIHRVRGLIRKDDAIRQRVIPNDLVAEVLELAHSDLIQRSVTVATDSRAVAARCVGAIACSSSRCCSTSSSTRATPWPTTRRGSPLSITRPRKGASFAFRSPIAARDHRGPIDAVFEPFVTSKPHGLGLGLAICRSIIDGHGGRMWAANNSSRGATFTFVLPIPVAVPTPAHLESARESARELARQSVLFEPAAN